MSCLFDSLSSFTNQSSSQLRQNIVAYLNTNPKLMHDITLNDILGWDNVDTNNYLDHMRRSDVWGGAIEIKAFVNMFNVNVSVHVPSHNKIIEFIVDEHNPSRFHTIHILWTGNHFTPHHLHA